MDGLKRLPLFVRIGLMWWVVLLVNPTTRELLLRPRPAPGLDPAGHVMAGLLSFAHSLAAGWIVVRFLQLRAGRPLSFDLPICVIVITWFAVASWALATVIPRVGLSLSSLYLCTVHAPVLSLFRAPGTTALLAVLAIATVCFVHRATRNSSPDPPHPTARCA